VNGTNRLYAALVNTRSHAHWRGELVTRTSAAALLSLLCTWHGWAQDTTPTAAGAESPIPPSSAQSELARRTAEAPAIVPQIVALNVPKGTPLHVALDEEVRVGKPSQAIQGHVVEPVYAFDKLVIPVGTKVTGQITQIEKVSAGKRTAAVLDADFTPAHKVQVEFTQVTLPDGKQIPVHTIVTPGSGNVVEFVSAADEHQGKGMKDAAAERTRAAKHEATQEWESAMRAVKQPGKMHRVGRFAVAQLPVHPNYIAQGTTYFAELQDPLDFGSEKLTPEVVSSLGATPPDGSVVEARLMTPLSSATASQGDAVEAIVSRPLFDGSRLILPQGSFLKGTVIQAQPAHHPGRNGQLRIAFREIQLESGVQQRVQATLAGVEAQKVDNVRLDSEGGAKATAPATRFLTTGVEVGLGGVSFLGDSFGETGPRAAGGAGGYKLIGIGLGLAIHSQPFGMAMGAFGGVRAIYVNFIARGREVVFPKNTAMSISVATRAPAAPTVPSANNARPQ
jgi:type IV secretory pathway VirB10-like protein